MGCHGAWQVVGCHRAWQGGVSWGMAGWCVMEAGRVMYVMRPGRVVCVMGPGRVVCVMGPGMGVFTLLCLQAQLRSYLPKQYEQRAQSIISMN